MQSFSELPLSPDLLKAIEAMGFVKPSPIQVETLPILLDEPTDFIGLAATGTGKTAAFGLPLLEKLDPSKNGVQALVMCPTRELAVQVAGQITLMGKSKGIKALPVYGGSSFGDQVYGLKQGASVVVGTPGRLVDHIKRGTLDLSELVTIVLDEADEMISMGFKEDLEAVLAAADRTTCRIWLFSATMDAGVRSVANQYLKNPKQVQVNKKEMLSENVEQIYFQVQERDKPEILCKLIDAADEMYGVIFCQTKNLVAELTQYLVDRGYKVDCLHGDKDQSARERTLNSFRAKRVTLLVCTDVAARGLDVKDITHVINYSLPRELDNYVHRIGRTARSGKSGIAMSLVTPAHRVLVQRIEKLTKSKMTLGKIPSRRDVAKKKITATLEKLGSQTDISKATELVSEAWVESLSTLSNKEIASRFLTLLFPELTADARDERPNESKAFRSEEPAPRDRPRRREARSGGGGGRSRDRSRDRSRERSSDRSSDQRRTSFSDAPKRTARREDDRPVAEGESRPKRERRPRPKGEARRFKRADISSSRTERSTKPAEGKNRSERRRAKFGPLPGADNKSL